MWSDGPATFDGTYYQIDGAPNNPPPVQDPHPRSRSAAADRGCSVWSRSTPTPGTWDHEPEPRPADRGEDRSPGRYLDEAGRSPDDVEYTWLGHCLVADSQQRVDELLERVLPVPSASPDQDFELTTAEEAREHGDYFIGTPAEVAEQIEAVADLGFERFQLMFIDYPSLEGLRLFADEVMPRV